MNQPYGYGNPQQFPAPDQSGNLRGIGIAHYVLGGLTALMSLFFLIYAFIGGAILASPDAGRGGNDAAVVSGIFIVIGIVGALFCVAWGGLKVYAGYCFNARKNYTFCFVMACLDCLNMPIGTVLGVLSIVVLMKPETKALFQRA